MSSKLYISETQVASSTPYDNTTSGLGTGDVQSALDAISNLVASGIISYNIISSTTFSTSASVDTLITGMTVVPVAGTYSIWYNAANSSTGSGQQLDCTIYNGATAIADSLRSNLSTAGTHIFQNSTQTISQFNGTNACSVKVDANGNSMTIGFRSLLLIRTGP
jgi:hypothetical protein